MKVWLALSLCILLHLHSSFAAKVSAAWSYNLCLDNSTRSEGVTFAAVGTNDVCYVQGFILYRKFDDGPNPLYACSCDVDQGAEVFDNEVFFTITSNGVTGAAIPLGCFALNNYSGPHQLTIVDYPYSTTTIPVATACNPYGNGTLQPVNGTYYSTNANLTGFRNADVGATWNVSFGDGKTLDPMCLGNVGLTVYACLKWELLTSTQALCYNSFDGTATVRISGTSAGSNYQVDSISPSGPTWSVVTSGEPTTLLISGLKGQRNYTITVRDHTDLLEEAVFIVNVFNPTRPNISALVVLSNVSCNNYGNAQIRLTASGGTGQLNLVEVNGLFPPRAVSNGTTVVSNMPSGTFTVVLQDSNGCLSTQWPLVITQPSKFSVTANKQDSLCYIGSNGNITATGSGGTPPYTYQLSGTVTASSGAQNGAYRFGGLPGGSYTVTATDSNGCPYPDTGDTALTFTLTQPPTALTVDQFSELVPTRCSGSGPTTFQFQLRTSGGNTTVAHTITVTPNPGTFSLTPNTLYTSTALAYNATYKVTVTDGNGCQATATLALTPPPTAVSCSLVQSVTSTCNGDNKNNIRVTANNGNSPYAAALLGAGPQTIASFTSPTQFPASTVSPGLRTVNVTDAYQCFQTCNVTVTEPTVVNFNVATILPTCNSANSGTNNNGRLNITNVVGGIPPYSVYINDTLVGSVSAAGGFFITTATLTAAPYKIIVSDSGLCNATQVVTLPQPTQIVFTSTITNSTCFGTNGSVQVTVSGATASGGPTYLVKLLGPPDLASSGSSSTQTVSAAANTYNGIEVQVTYSSSGITCTASNTATVTVAQPALMVPTIGVANAVCSYQSATLTLAVTGPAGATISRLFRSDGTTINNPTSPIAVATGFSYIIRATSVSSCHVNSSSTGVLVTPPAVTHTQSVAPALCSYLQGSITVTNVQLGGSSMIPFCVDGTTYNSVPQVFARSAGTYTLNVTDCATGCASSNNAALTVTAPSGLGTTLTVPQGDECNTGIINVRPINGTATYSLRLFNSANAQVGSTVTSLAANFNRNFTGLVAGTYTVEITDSVPCSNNHTVTVPTILPVRVNITDTSCQLGTVYRYIICVDRGQANYVLTNNCANSPQTLTTAGCVTVACTLSSITASVVDSLGCSASSAATSTVSYTNITFTSVLHQDGYCPSQGGSVDVTISGGFSPYTVQLVGPQVHQLSGNGPIFNFTNVAAGTYVVTAVDNRTCLVSYSSVTIVTPAAFSITGVNQPASCNPGNPGVSNDGSMTVTVTGGTLPYVGVSYNSTSFLSSPYVISPAVAGNYTIVVTDARLCMGSAYLLFTYPPLLTFTPANQAVTCHSSSTIGSTTVTPNFQSAVSGGNSPYQTVTINGSVVYPVTAVGPLSVGSYTAVLTDNKGCNASASFSVTQPAALSLTVQDTSCPLQPRLFETRTGGSNPRTVRVYNSTGVQLSSTNANNQNMAAQFDDLLRVQFMDNNGCGIETNINLPSLANITSTETFADITCTALGSLGVQVSGGSPQYTVTLGSTSHTTVAGIASFTGITAGSKTLTISDVRGCLGNSKVYNFTTPPPPGVTPAATAPPCVGQLGTLTLTIASGLPPFVVKANGLSNSSVTALDSVIFPFAAATVVAWNVTDANQCLSSGSTTIPSATPLKLLVSSVVPPSCIGSSDGWVLLTATGGATPYNRLEWFRTGGPTTVVSGTSPYNVTGLSDGGATLNWQVFDNNGCSASNSTAPLTASGASLTGSITQSSSVSCSGLSDAVVTISASGGTSPYQLTLLMSNGTQTSKTLASAGARTFSGLPAGQYGARITDNKGCVFVPGTNATVTQPTPLTVVTNSTPYYGPFNLGKLNVTVSGGTPTYTVTVAPFTPQTVTTSGGKAIFNSMQAQNYTVTVTDARSCQWTDVVQYDNSTALQMDLIIYTCLKSSVRIYASSGLPSGTCPASCYYNATLLQNGVRTNYTVPFGGLIVDVSPTGIVTVNVTDSLDVTATATVDPAAMRAGNPLSLNYMVYDRATCYTGNPLLDSGFLHVGLLDGYYPATQPDISLPYLGQIQSSVLNMTYVSNMAGEFLINQLPANNSYTFTAFDDYGCNITLQFYIGAPTPINASFGLKNQVRCRNENTASISGTIIGGNGSPYRLIGLYPPDGPDAAAINSGTFPPGLYGVDGLTGKTYYVNISDPRGCTTTTSVDIPNPTFFEFQALLLQPINCYGFTTRVDINVTGGLLPYTLTITPTPPFPYNTTLTSAGIYTLPSVPRGFYNISAVDALGCPSPVSYIPVVQPGILKVVRPLPMSCHHMYKPIVYRFNYTAGDIDSLVNITLMPPYNQPNITLHTVVSADTYNMANFTWTPHHVLPGLFNLEVRSSDLSGCILEYSGWFWVNNLYRDPTKEDPSGYCWSELPVEN